MERNTPQLFIAQNSKDYYYLNISTLPQSFIQVGLQPSHGTIVELVRCISGGAQKLAEIQKRFKDLLSNPEHNNNWFYSSPELGAYLDTQQEIPCNIDGPELYFATEETGLPFDSFYMGVSDNPLVSIAETNKEFGTKLWLRGSITGDTSIRDLVLSPLGSTFKTAGVDGGNWYEVNDSSVYHFISRLPSACVTMHIHNAYRTDDVDPVVEALPEDDVVISWDELYRILPEAAEIDWSKKHHYEE